ncbi:MAG: DUF1553 domain-containing protein [Bacteroidetes bacterium]|nr:DUF1553 domain-containing protein [Bacteroidota bacterium]
MPRILSFALFGAIVLTGCSVEKPPEIVEAESRIPEKISFSLHVKPILSDRCYSCHGPDAEGRVTNLRFDTAEGIRAKLTESRRSRAVRGGSPGRSEMVHRILSDDPEYRMPPPESNLSLTAEEKAILIRWIEQGGEYESHWSFTAPKVVKLPSVLNDSWPKDDLDRFILSNLTRNDLQPADAAPKEVWLRRVSFDLTGLPPTVAEVDAFLADKSSNAFEKVVDRLLASPGYGERMTVDWLDLARYADSHGYQDDGWRNMWPWRDWVIRAFNANKPYDEFVTEQLAGDLLENPTRDQILATGFNRNHLQSQEGGIVLEEYRVDYVADRTNTFGKAFLGITTECARCHDHRYDPISQLEYYEIFSFFNSVNEIGNIPYAGEASPTVLLTTEVDDQKLADIKRKIGQLEASINPTNSVYDNEYGEWIKSHATSVIEPQGMTAYYPIEAFVEKKDLLTLEDRVQPDSAGYFWGDKDNLPTIVKGKNGNAMTLVGDGWLDMGGKRHHFDRTDAFSLSLWFKIEDPEAYGPLMAKTSGLFDGDRGYHAYLNPDHTFTARLVHVGPDNEIAFQTTDSVSTGNWHQIVMTYDGSSRAAGLRLFMDGTVMPGKVLTDNLKQSMTVTIDPNTGDSTNWAGSGDLRLGFTDNNQKMLVGVTLDEFKVFNRALTVPEVHVLAGVSTKSDDLRSYFVTSQSKTYKENFRAITKLREQENVILTNTSSVMVMKDLPEPRETHILYRGQYDQPLDKVEPGTPKAILPFSKDLPRNRLGLAQWLFDEANPLTARVAVNRLWQQVFGKGIVESSDNFGSQGTVPTYPELLDYLAVEYRSSGWDTKKMLKRLVLSATYRQSSVVSSKMRDRDPENKLLARGPSRRLTAEMMRDNALATSGLLVSTIGGRPVKPYQPAGLWEEQATRNGTTYVQDHGESLYRRSMYTIWKRTTPPPAMMNFDTSERNLCIIKRQSTATPLQALVLMNDPQFIEAARLLAERMLSEGGSADEARIRFGFRGLTGSEPSPENMKTLLRLLASERKRFRGDPGSAKRLAAAGEYRVNSGLPAAEVAAFATVATTLFNFDATQVVR